MGYQNILENDGISIAITGMSIVFIALLLISVFIALLPKILRWLAFILPEEPHAGLPARGSRGEEEEVIAAIGMAFHHQQKQKRQGKK